MQDIFRLHVGFGLFAVTLLILVFFLPLSSANNTINVSNPETISTIPLSPSETPFITIDPIGNHNIGDIFFINGTTNLPVNTNLSLNIISIWQPAMKNSEKTYYYCLINNISVVLANSSSPEVNLWSVNVTDPVKKNLINDDYNVLVYPSYEDPDNLTQSSIVGFRDDLTLLPATNDTSNAVTLQQTYPPQQTLKNSLVISPTNGTLISPSVTQSSGGSFVLQIILLLVVIVIMKSILREREENDRN